MKIISVIKRLKNQVIKVLLKTQNGNKISFQKGKIQFNKGLVISLKKDSSLEIGNNFCARDYFYVITEPNAKITIGNNVFFNNFCSINSLCSINIGNDTIFGENVHIYDHNHNYKNTTQLIREQGFSVSPVSIGNNCWIGSNVLILKGVRIGNNCIIGAGSVVYKDISDNKILLSNGEIKNK